MTHARATWLFLLLAFAISWTISEAGFYLLPRSRTTMVVVSVLFMSGPAIAAVATTRLVLLEPLSWLGPLWRWNRWLLVAIAGPLAFTAGWLAVTPLVPGLALTVDSAALADNVLNAVPESRRPLIAARLATLGDALLPLLIAQLVVGGVIAGTTVNALAAFGEELGWRGLLHRTLGGLGLWRRGGFIGVFWGLWHLPMILRGHNYSGHPALGALAMIVLCVLLSPLFEYVRERSGSLLAPVWMHGTLNALGGAALLVQGPDLLRGPAGLTGMLVLAGCNVMLWWHLRKHAQSATPAPVPA